MRRVAEILYIVESQRELFIKNAVNPDAETRNVLWLCGVRKQQYFQLNDFIFMSFEYEGKSFREDMAKMAAYLDSKGKLIKQRRKDIPVEQRKEISWWAPVKSLGVLLEEKPSSGEDNTAAFPSYSEMLSGCVSNFDGENNMAYDENDWTETVQIF